MLTRIRFKKELQESVLSYKAINICTIKGASNARQKGWRLPFRKRAVNLRKTWHLLTLVFANRKIEGFPIVLLSVNWSIRSIIR